MFCIILELVRCKGSVQVGLFKSGICTNYKARPNIKLLLVSVLPFYFNRIQYCILVILYVGREGHEAGGNTYPHA